VLGAACGETQAGEPPWEAVPLPLGSGHIYATYDAQRDVIWLLNWAFADLAPPGQPSAATLARFEPESRKFQRYTIRGSADGLGGDAGLAVDSEGAVWAAWGRRLIRLAPASGETKEWAIPQPDAADLEGYEGSGMAVEVAPAPDGRVWVALLFTSAVIALDPATGAWSRVDTAPLMAIERSRLTFADGRLLLNGVTRGNPAVGVTPGGGSAMVSIDPAAGEATLSDIAAFAYWVRQDGTVDYVDGDTGEARVLTAGGADMATAARFAVDELHPIRQVMAGGGGDGSVWLWQSGKLRLDLVRLDADTGETSSYSYPLVTFIWDGGGPFTVDRSNLIGKTMAHSPEVHGLVVDRRGDLWVVSANTKVYPALYRLHAEQP